MENSDIDSCTSQPAPAETAPVQNLPADVHQPLAKPAAAASRQSSPAVASNTGSNFKFYSLSKHRTPVNSFEATRHAGAQPERQNSVPADNQWRAVAGG